MAADLETELNRLFRPLPPPVHGLAAAKRRGQRRQRRRRAAGGVLTLTATAALVVAIAAGPLTHHPRADVQVGSDPRHPSGATLTEPTVFVAELESGHVAVVVSRTGRVVRQLTAKAHDIFGTLSADGATFYLDVPAGDEPNCPPGLCAVSVATGATTVIPAFRWGAVTPSPADTSISPDGTHEATTNFDDSPLGLATGRRSAAPPTVTIATTTGDPVTHRLQAGDQVYADPLWSPDGTYLNVANAPGVPGRRSAAPVILDATTGTLRTLQLPVGCSVQPMVLSNTRLFTSEYCRSTGMARILPYELATGRLEAPIADPPDTTSVGGLGTDPTGQHLIATSIDSLAVPAARQDRVWTEQSGGPWTRVPRLRATAVAW